MEERRITGVSLHLAEELNSLSIEERNRVYESIHGVDDVIQETPELLSEKILALEEEIGKIEKKQAYKIACGQGRSSDSYITQDSFRLMFLRAANFEVPEAAARLVCYMEEKLARFGHRALARPLEFKDLSEGTKKLMYEHGIHQILPARDSAGRVVYLMHHYSACRDIIRKDHMAGTDLLFFMASAIAEDEESQKRGMVSLQVIADLPAMEDMEMVQRIVKQSNAEAWCPIRIKAIHYWIKPVSDHPIVQKLMEILTGGLSRNSKTLTRLHNGSYVETRYRWLTFGIPVDALPYSTDGEELRLTAHNKWISRRKKRETKLRATGSFTALDLPGCRDVCLGRGSASHQHAGNIYMRMLMAPMVEEYRDAEGKDRQALNKRLVQMVRDQGGRFLTKTTGGWYEEVAKDSEIEKRVGGSFRGLLSRSSSASSITTSAAAATTASSTGDDEEGESSSKLTPEQVKSPGEVKEASSHLTVAVVAKPHEESSSSEAAKDPSIGGDASSTSGSTTPAAAAALPVETKRRRLSLLEEEQEEDERGEADSESASHRTSDDATEG